MYAKISVSNNISGLFLCDPVTILGTSHIMIKFTLLSNVKRIALLKKAFSITHLIESDVFCLILNNHIRFAKIVYNKIIR